MSNSNINAKAALVKLIIFDFDGVFTDNSVMVLEDGTEAVVCSRSDGFGLELARRNNIKLIVLSTEKNPVVSARCKKLSLNCIQSCEDKAEKLKFICCEMDISPENCAYLGNDINDLGCLEIVGFPACVNDAYPELHEKCLYITKKSGGHGAVREFCEFIVNSKNQANK